jgi:hypothetical protein
MRLTLAILGVVAGVASGCSDSAPLSLDQKQKVKGLLESASEVLDAAESPSSSVSSSVSSRLQEQINDKSCVSSRKYPKNGLSEGKYSSEVLGEKCAIRYVSETSYEKGSDRTAMRTIKHYETRDDDFALLNDVTQVHMEASLDSDLPSKSGKVRMDGEVKIKSTKYGWTLITRKAEGQYRSSDFSEDPEGEGVQSYAVSFPEFSMVLREVTRMEKDESGRNKEKSLYYINSEEVELSEYKTYTDLMKEIF